VRENGVRSLAASCRQARVVHARRRDSISFIRVQLPTSCPERALFRAVALGLMRSGP
jgi:hypothetical protein